MTAIEVPTAQEMMRRYVVSLTPDMQLVDAVEIMRRANIHSAPIVSIDREVVGYLSDADCVSALAGAIFRDEARPTVGEVMKPDVWTVSEDEDLFEVEAKFAWQGLRHAPGLVVEGDHLGHATGQVPGQDDLGAAGLARFKRPRLVKFVDDFPKTPIGKIQKTVLKEPYWQESEKKI